MREIYRPIPPGEWFFRIIVRWGSPHGSKKTNFVGPQESLDHTSWMMGKNLGEPGAKEGRGKRGQPAVETRRTLGWLGMRGVICPWFPERKTTSPAIGNGAPQSGHPAVRDGGMWVTEMDGITTPSRDDRLAPRGGLPKPLKFGDGPVF